jgi:hypothetical protein
MFNTDFGRVVISALGALLFTATVVSAAVGPAHMAETRPLIYAEAAQPVGGGIDA